LFNGNGLTFVAGNQGEESNWLNMPYNTDTQSYEVELVVTLNRVGGYSFITDDSVHFIGENCNRFRLDTNIAWSVYGIIGFEVLED